MPETESIVDFESSLQELEEIVNKMEQGQLSLEQSLNAFEQGVQLTRKCQPTLKNAEQRVSTLIKKDDALELNSFKQDSPAQHD